MKNRQKEFPIRKFLLPVLFFTMKCKCRQLAFTDIDQAVCEILKQTLDYLRDQGGEIDPATEVTYSYYLQKCAEAENAE